ncbi:MAG: COG1361 S-layer family protein [archaeon]
MKNAKKFGTTKIEAGNSGKGENSGKDRKGAFAFAAITFLMLAVFSAAIPAAFSVRMGSADAYGIVVGLTSQTPDPAAAGQQAEIRLSIFNTGGKEIENLSVELVELYPIKLLEGTQAVQNIGTLQGYQGTLSGEDAQIVKYRVLVDKDAPAGTYELNVRYSNKVLSGEQTLDFSVSSKEGVEVSAIDKTLLIPGAETPITFTIKNVGSASLKNLVFSWQNSDGAILPLGSDNTKHISFLDVGESRNVSYLVLADSSASAGLYKLNLSISYDDSTQTSSQRTISTTAGIYVGGGTDFDVSISESSGESTSFSIANIGSNPAYSVSVRIPSQSGWSVTGSSSAMIGNLNTGDYTSTSFVLSSSRAASNFTGAPRGNFSSQTQGSVKVEIAYTDTTGARQIVEKTVAALSQASSSQTALSSAADQFVPGVGFVGQRTRQQQQQSVFVKYMWPLIGSGAAITLVVAYLFYRAKKKDNPDLTLKGFFFPKKKPAAGLKGDRK